MKNNGLFILLFFVSFSALAQIKGVVKDSITGKPIPYVSIAVENENLGTTSEENGEFTIHVSEKSKKLIFSTLGFERKTVAISNASDVRLKPMAYQLDELMISKRLETRQKEIGKNEGQILEAFDNGPRIDTKFFAYEPSYKKTKYLKQVVINTDSKIEDATFKIHFYSVDANGDPGNQLLDKDLIVSVNRGVKETRFNLKKFNLLMPKQGLFVGFEKLLIEKNKGEGTQRAYFPFVLYASVERDFQITYSGGKWLRQTGKNENGQPRKMRLYEPAIYLILTN